MPPRLDRRGKPIAILFWASPDADVVPGTYLAFDDTDSPDGMCTTYLATVMVEALGRFDLIGLPRLVRLNPNVPWKTRGNAAVAMAVGRGRGDSTVCGELAGREVRSYAEGLPVSKDEVLRIACEVIENNAEFDCEKTNPGVVCTDRRPSQQLYWKAVREEVDLPSVERLLGKDGASWRKYKNGRGVIGASAALSWRPHDRTWEVIAYRAAGAIGTRRGIDIDSVVEMDRATEHTFNNYDHLTGHVAIAPSSPCPVLFGIRGDSPEELLRARVMVRGEVQDRWLLFLTNQGTDDHIVRRRIRTLRPGDSARVTVRVVGAPETLQGGHVVVKVADGDGIDAAFYEPSGPLRAAARKLVVGDRLVLFGSVRDAPRSINVEKMRVLSLENATVKTANPLCPDCGKRMGSLGRGQGYRCKRCGVRADESDADHRAVDRGISPGWYEPPVASRRHLYKPIRRLSKVNINNLL